MLEEQLNSPALLSRKAGELFVKTKNIQHKLHSLFVVHFLLYMLKYLYGASIMVGGCPLMR